MRVKDLLDNEYMKCYGNENTQVLGLSDNSKLCAPGDIFFAISGTKVDGKDFAFEAIKNGAVAVVSNEKINLPSDIVNIVCKDERRAMADISAGFYNYPAKELFIIGVTGTNGKTTTTFMLESVFKEAGKKVGIIGTNGVFFDGEKVITNMTTPDPISLQKILANMRDRGVQIVCMEMSAHALELQKNRGVMTDIALFTNLSQDHLDFFENMKKYYQAKAKLFTPQSAIIGGVNIDDKSGERLYKESKIPMLTYSLDKQKGAGVYAEKLEQTFEWQRFKVGVLGETEEIKLNLLGDFNISNALASICAGFIYGLKLETIKRGLEKVQEVDGRFNIINVNGILVIIDYAHTPDGLENILKTATKMTSGRVFSVFGCGGNRDKTKRAIMGEISEKYAFYTFITTDNPRYEDPFDIAKQVQEKMLKTTNEIELNRELAILKAFNMADKQDIIVISGKGSENYIEQNGEKRYYQDKDVVLKIKNNLFANN